MKFLGVLLAIFAVSYVRANSEECTEERVKACMENFLPYTLSDSTVNEAELCRELGSSFDCLKEAKYDCLGELDLEVNDKFEELKEILNKCAALYNKYYEESYEIVRKISACYWENVDYIMKCVDEGNQQALTLLMKKDDLDEHTLKCKLQVSGCYFERIREKCGEIAVRLAEGSDMPDEIAEACNAVGDNDNNIINAIHLTGEDKRK